MWRTILSLCLIVVMLGCGKKARDIDTTEDTPSTRGTRGADKSIDFGTGNKYALVVGVGKYGNKAFNDLRYTENDAEELTRALQQQWAGFRVQVMTGARGKADKNDVPTAANIKKALDELLAKRQKGDVVLIALAGHGVTLELKDPAGKEAPRTYPYFCAADADLLDPRFSDGQSVTMINLDELFAKLSKCGAGTKLLLMDACRNELTMKAGRRSLDAGRINIPLGVAALYSAGRGQFAFETDKLGEKGHGVFFHFVIEGLRGKAKNDEGVVTWASLTDYATRQVSREVPKIIGGGARQTPAALGNLEGESPVLVAAEGKKDKEGTVIRSSPDKELTNSVGMKLVLLPAGKFLMGVSPLSAIDIPLRDINGEQREVELTKSFYMGVYEVTQDEYEKVMGNNPSWFCSAGGGKDKVKDQNTRRFPADSIPWDEASEFCERLSEKVEEKREGRAYRLPTEAEWEYACRGGASPDNYSPFHYGEKMNSRQANFDGRFPGLLGSKGPNLERTTTVGSYQPNGFGLYDMHGNVAEWCADFFTSYRSLPKKDPVQAKDPGNGWRIFRGGSWKTTGNECHSGCRNQTVSSLRQNTHGFRVVCVIKGSGG